MVCISGKTMVIVGSFGSLIPLTLMIMCVIPESKLLGFVMGMAGTMISALYITCGLIMMKKQQDKLLLSEHKPKLIGI